MNIKSLNRLLALLFAFAMVAAACGGSDDSDDADDADTTEDEQAVDAGEDEPEDDSESEEPADTDTAVEASDDERVSGGEIAIGLESELTGMRPWEDTCSSPCYNVHAAVFDKLTEATADGGYEGWLFETIEPNEDFTQWVGTLRPGVVFHNGKELTAQTIADMFPIQQTGSAAQSVIAATALQSVEATGDLEVTYTLGQPHSAFSAYLSRTQIGMVFDPELAADAEEFNRNPVGTGAFMVESRDLDNETVVVRNPDYWMTDADGTQLPYLDKISFRPIPDEGTRLDATLSGTTQVAQTLRQGTIRDARAARDEGEAIELVEFQGNNTGGGMFNVAVPPFDDIRVRMGLTLMNSQEQVIEALGGTGISLPATQWFSPDSPWYSEKVAEAWPKFDFEAGQAMLQEYVDDPERSDGLAVGEPIDIELSCPPDPTLIAAMQVLEQTWTATELVTANLTNFDQQTHINYALGLENGFVGDHGAHCWRWSDDNDPSFTINVAVAPPTAEVAEAAGVPGVVSPQNFPNYFDGDVFQAAVGAVRTDNFDERKALYESIMLKFAEDVPIWYSGYTATALITDPSVKGLTSWELPSGTLGAGIPNAEARWSQVWVAQ